MNVSLQRAGTRPRSPELAQDRAIDWQDSANHDAPMRTTVDLPENLHRIAIGLARHTGRSLSEAVADLMQRGLAADPSQAGAKPFAVHAATGLPVARSKRPITADDVKAVEDVA